ncbi:hypothetical protein AKJ09_09803 [Labilithrix luteola]|uniref:Uncharacterized protein n=1 Tax=Labilithrix luteola TaxID=1391654 RepID=A0A0K1QCI3_9BACT|nr:hypothetical protein AKJ09_09803 [Labilithrix luteola]
MKRNGIRAQHGLRILRSGRPACCTCSAREGNAQCGLPAHGGHTGRRTTTLQAKERGPRARACATSKPPRLRFSARRESSAVPWLLNYRGRS